MDEDGFSLKDQRVCVVGLGLMGGSLALALAGQVDRLAAVDSDPAACQLALERGIAGQASGDLSLVAKLLVYAALRSGSRDDVTVIVVQRPKAPDKDWIDRLRESQEKQSRCA